MVTDKRSEGNKNQSLNNLENVISKRLPVEVLRAGKKLLVFLQCLQDHANSIFNVFLNHSALRVHWMVGQMFCTV